METSAGDVLARAAEPGTLGTRTRAQLAGLCELYGIPPDSSGSVLTELLGSAARWPLQQQPPWHSDVADDATPVEFSVAFDGARRKVRVLGETIAEPPSAKANLRTAEQFVAELHSRGDVVLDKLRAVQDLFTPQEPRGAFAWWYSVILDPDGPPKFKVYFNPEVHGREAASELVEQALSRLGLPAVQSTLDKYALRRFDQDVVSFFAVDLDSGDQARVKIYVSHLDGSAQDAVRTAQAVPGLAHERIEEFCAALAPGTTVFGGRPLVSSYSFVDGDTSTPSNYSLYVPVRDYVPHDAVARERVLRALEPHGVGAAEVDRITAAVTNRSLHEAAGLLAHVSLRLSPESTGTTLYVSSEAYSSAT